MGGATDSRATVLRNPKWKSSKCKSNYPFIEPHKIASENIIFFFFLLHGTRFICFVVEPYTVLWELRCTTQYFFLFFFVHSIRLNWILPQLLLVRIGMLYNAVKIYFFSMVASSGSIVAVKFHTPYTRMEIEIYVLFIYFFWWVNFIPNILYRVFHMAVIRNPLRK